MTIVGVVVVVTVVLVVVVGVVTNCDIAMVTIAVLQMGLKFLLFEV